MIGRCEIQDGRGGGYWGDDKDGNNFEVVGEEEVYEKMDVVVGGGKEWFEGEG